MTALSVTAQRRTRAHNLTAILSYDLLTASQC